MIKQFVFISLIFFSCSSVKEQESLIIESKLLKDEHVQGVLTEFDDRLTQLYNEQDIPKSYYKFLQELEIQGSAQEFEAFILSVFPDSSNGVQMLLDKRMEGILWNYELSHNYSTGLLEKKLDRYQLDRFCLLFKEFKQTSSSLNRDSIYTRGIESNGDIPLSLLKYPAIIREELNLDDELLRVLLIVHYNINRS